MVQFCYVRLYVGIETVSAVATDGQDGHGLKIGNIGPSFQVCLNASPKKIFLASAP